MSGVVTIIVDAIIVVNVFRINAVNHNGSLLFISSEGNSPCGRVDETRVVIHLAGSFSRHVNHVHVARTFHFYKISMREAFRSYAPLYPK